MSTHIPSKPEPARGALAGIKADLERAKQSGQAYDPRGHGNAFTHNFLNQKPWHPMNFRNQIKKFEAEAQSAADKKAKEEAQAEFQAEQEHMLTLSFLSETEQQRYKDRQSLSFMYTKPPGLEAALAKDAEREAAARGAAAKEAAAGAGGAAGSSTVLATAALAQGASQQGGREGQQGGKGGRPQLTEEEREAAASRARDLDRVREDPFAVMLQARAALQANQRLQIRGAGGSPVHGGFASDAANQMLLGVEEGPSGAVPLQQHLQPHHDPQGGGSGLVAAPEDLALLASMTDSERSAVLKRLRKMQREQEQLQQLEQAKAVLQAAGYDIRALPTSASGHKRKHKKEKKSKKKSKKSKGSKSSKHSGHKRGGESDSSDSSDSCRD